MKRHVAGFLFLSALILSPFTAIASPAASEEREAWFRNFELYSRIDAARLIMSVEVTGIEEEKVILGGKGELSVVQIRFRPLKVFKGVYTRSELLLTDKEIGGYRYAQSHVFQSLRRGERRLLLLDRTSQGYGLAGHAESFDHAVPPLRGGDDALLEAVRTLIEVQRKGRRLDQARLMLGALGKVNGAGAVALLRAVKVDAVLISQYPGGIDSVARHLKDSSPAVRAEAASTLQAVLEQDYLVQQQLHERAVEHLLDALGKGEKNLAAVKAYLHALSAARPASVSARLRESLAKTSSGDPLALNAARLRAAGSMRVISIADSLAARLADTPVDTPNEVIHDIALGAIAFNPKNAADALYSRIERKLAAGLMAGPEIKLLSEFPKAEAVEVLLKLSRRPLTLAEQAAFAETAETHPDKSLVNALSHWLGGYHISLRYPVLNALRKIDTREAAAAARAELGPELDLGEKMRLAEFLGRQGFRDGYAFAVEHMSESHLRAHAVAALVAMRDPRTVAEMTRILETSNDDAWNASAVLVLGGLGERKMSDRFAEYARGNGRLAAAAMVALAELGDERVLAQIRRWLDHADHDMNAAAAKAARIALVKHRMPGEDIAATMMRIVSRGNDWSVTREAFDTLAALDHAKLDEAAAAALRNGRLNADFEKLIIERLRRNRVAVLPEPAG